MSTGETVKRWDCWDQQTMEECATGEFVSAEDYTALERQVQKLRSIDAAPKDGTWILAHHARWTLPEIVQWSSRGYWQSMGAGPFYPTHWIPLPAPPDTRGQS